MNQASISLRYIRYLIGVPHDLIIYFIIYVQEKNVPLILFYFKPFGRDMVIMIIIIIYSNSVHTTADKLKMSLGPIYLGDILFILYLSFHFDFLMSSKILKFSSNNFATFNFSISVPFSNLS